MAHPDPCWRVAAIYRACRRWGKDQAWAFAELSKLKDKSVPGILIRYDATALATIWFRENTAGTSHMSQSRQSNLEQ